MLLGGESFPGDPFATTEQNRFKITFWGGAHFMVHSGPLETINDIDNVK